MGLAGNLAKKAGKAAAKKAGQSARTAVNKRNPHFCPGSDNGRHNFKSEKIDGHPVVYCKNPGCGKVH